MAVTAKLYGNGIVKAYNKEIDFDSDTIKVALVASTYTPNQDTHKDWSAPTWVASTAYSVGDLVIPTTPNGHIYKATVAGTSGSTEPTWPTDGTTVTDGSVTWEDQGTIHVEYDEVSGTGYTAGGETLTTATVSYDAATNVIKLDGDDVSWANSTITAQYAVIYDDTPTATKPLIAYVDFGQDESSSDGTFKVTWDADGMATVTVS